MKQCIHQAISSHQPCGNFFQLKKIKIKIKIPKRVVAFRCIFIVLASSQLMIQLQQHALVSYFASYFIFLQKKEVATSFTPRHIFASWCSFHIELYGGVNALFGETPTPRHLVSSYHECKLIHSWTIPNLMCILIHVLCIINFSDDDFVKASLGEMGYNRRSYKKTIPNYKFIKGQLQIGIFNK